MSMDLECLLLTFCFLYLSREGAAGPSFLTDSSICFESTLPLFLISGELMELLSYLLTMVSYGASSSLDGSIIMSFSLIPEYWSDVIRSRFINGLALSSSKFSGILSILNPFNLLSGLNGLILPIDSCYTALVKSSFSSPSYAGDPGSVYLYS